MHSDLVELGWTEEHFQRIYAAVSEEAQKARVGAQMLSLVGPLDGATTATPSYGLTPQPNPRQNPPVTPAQRLSVNSNPDLPLTRIAVNVQLRTQDALEPNLYAALTMFRRAANYVARIEDALIFNGRPAANNPPPFGIAGIPNVYSVTGDGAAQGLFVFNLQPAGRNFVFIPLSAGQPLGHRVIDAVIESINALERQGQLGPYACALAPDLFAAICAPNPNLVLPRDRILPFLQGPLLRTSAIAPGFGVVLALSANPIELVVASDIQVRFLQMTEEPRLAFQVYERVALRIKEPTSIAVMM